MSIGDPDLPLKSNLIAGMVYENSKKQAEVKDVTDGVFCARGLKEELNIIKGNCSLLDDTPATAKLNIGLTTTSTIKVSVEAEDIESGILGYQYSLDGGTNYTDTITNNSYTFTKLKQGTVYNIKVKVINGNKLESYTETKMAKTSTIDPPTYVVDKMGWQQQKVVTITYPKGDDYKYSYSLDRGTTWVDAIQGQTVTFIANGTVTARVSDGTNTVSSNVLTVDQIDTDEPIIIVAGNTDVWTVNKKIVISANDNGELDDSAYSFDGGKTWQVSNIKTITSNGTYVVKVRDKAGNVATTSIVVTKISITIPIISIKTKLIGTSYIQVEATVTDNEMGTAEIEFSKDNGATYTSNGINTIYTFTRLNKDTKYTIKARVTSHNGKVGISNILTESTENISMPTYIVDKTGWQQQKMVTITYPKNADFVYSYSIDKGATWKTAVQEQKVTFTANGTVIARVSDGTNTVTANVFTVDQIDRIAPTMSVAGNTDAWTTNKTLTVTASDNGALAASAYSFDNGATWQASNAKTITSNGTYVVKVKDQAGNISTQSVVVSKISVTAPTITISKVASGSNYVTIKATVTDNEMGTAKIEFSKDNGTTYVSNGTNETYTFLGLTNNTSYNFKARVTSKNGKVGISSVLSVTTSSLSAPTYVVDKTGWQQQKIVTINYPSITEQTLTYEYSTDKGATWKTAVQGQKVTYTANGTVIGRVSDGTNVITASVFTVNQIDRTAPVISSVAPNTTAYNTSLTLTINATDSESGLHAQPYSFDGGSTWTATKSKAFTTAGTINIRVRDALGNVSSKSVVINSRIEYGYKTPSAYSSSSTTSIPASGYYKVGTGVQSITFNYGGSNEANNSRDYGSLFIPTSGSVGGYCHTGECRTMYIQGSANGSSWTNLCSYYQGKGGGGSCSISTSSSYRYYRLSCASQGVKGYQTWSGSACTGTAAYWWGYQIASFVIYGKRNYTVYHEVTSWNAGTGWRTSGAYSKGPQQQPTTRTTIQTNGV